MLLRPAITLQHDTTKPMIPSEQSEWIARHIPHRVRAAVARLPMKNSLLQVEASIDPVRRTEQDEIYGRCATDSIWEGRLAATRWPIEFVGIKRDENGKPAECNKKKRSKDDIPREAVGGRVSVVLLTLKRGAARKREK